MSHIKYFQVIKVENPSDSFEKLLEVLPKGVEYRWWIATPIDHPALWIAYSSLSRYNDDILYSGSAYVLREYRGLGLQFQILKAKIKWAKEQNKWKSIRAQVQNNNFASITNLLKAGFCPVKPWDNFKDEIFLELQLENAKRANH